MFKRILDLFTQSGEYRKTAIEKFNSVDSLSKTFSIKPYPTVGFHTPLSRLRFFFLCTLYNDVIATEDWHDSMPFFDEVQYHIEALENENKELKDKVLDLQQQVERYKVFHEVYQVHRNPNDVHWNKPKFPYDKYGSPITDYDYIVTSGNSSVPAEQVKSI